MLDQLIEEKWLTASGVFGLFPANAVGDDIEVYLDERSRRVVEAVCTAADGLGVQPLEVALAWVRDRPGVTSPVVGARTAAQLRGALPVEQISLPEEIRVALDEVSAPVVGYPERTR